MRGSEAVGQPGRRTAGLAEMVGGILRRIAGMPDYASYLEHMRRCHPDSPAATEREFFAEFVRGRYQDGSSRCC